MPPKNISLVIIKEQSSTFDGPDNIQRTQTIPFKLPSNAINI